MPWKCNADRSLPLQEQATWDGAAAEARIFAWAGWPDNPRPDDAGRCFLAANTDQPDIVASYKLPFCDVVNVAEGQPAAITAGLDAAANALPQAGLPDDVIAAAEQVVEAYNAQRRGDQRDPAQPGSSGWGDTGPGDGGGGGDPPGPPPPNPPPPEPPPNPPPHGDAHGAWFSAPRTPNPVNPVSEANPVRSPAIHLQAALQLAHTGDRRAYLARLIRAGRIRYADNSPGPFTIPPQALQAALAGGQFAGLPTFIDHAGFFENPSLRNLAGTVTEPRWNPADQAVEGTIRLYNTAAGQLVADLFDQVIDDHDNGRPTPDLGLSLVFWPSWEANEDDGEPLTLAGFRHIESCDFVVQPAADGRILQALRALAPDFGSLPDSRSLSLKSHPVNPVNPVPSDPARERSSPMSEWLNALQQTTIDAMIAQSGLPTAAQTYLRSLRSQAYATPAQLTAAIDAQRHYLAELQADTVVHIGNQPPRGSRISLRSSLDQVETALVALLSGKAPAGDVAPLTGIRELYHILSGDYEMHGIFQGDRVALANVNSSTMAALVANALNKVVVNIFQEYPRWWEPIVKEMDFQTLQDVRWITLGGVGELPTVPEGGSYTELTWDDNTETASFVKKGGYLGITLETIDKDDTGKVRSAPQALAQAAWLTLSKSIAGIFTTNANMGDGVALFHNTHGNLGSTALSYTALNATRTLMMKQTELNSGERLGALTRPYYLVVPIDLENTALVIMASEGMPGSANNDTNPFSEGNEHDQQLANARKRVVVCPIWTDATDWVAAANPQLYPSIAIGYRYGRTPQIFSVASPTAGLMFTNDTLPVKVRFFYATGPVDYRGLYKHVVAG